MSNKVSTICDYCGKVKEVSLARLKLSHHFCSRKCWSKWRKKNNPNTWNLYNGQLMDMRQSGLTLQAIGDKVGRTRERVRQVLKEHYRTTKIRGLIAREPLAARLGCSYQRLEDLEKLGIIKSLHSGWFYLYDKIEAEKARLALIRFCEHCGKPLPLKDATKLCPECQQERKRYAYPFFSEETKKRVGKRCYAWMKRNPEKNKELRRRGEEKRRKEHYSTTTYEVFRGTTLPVGTIITAVGCKNGHLILEDGSTIPAGLVRKIRKEVRNGKISYGLSYYYQ